MFIGIILSFASGAFVALSMVTQRYALTYPDYKVPVLGIFKLPRPAVWLLGLVLYGAANALFAAAQLFGPLSLMSSLFVLLLVWNLFFSRLILGEQLTAPKVAGAALVVLGALCTVLGQPATFGSDRLPLNATEPPDDFTPAVVLAFLQQPLGCFYFVLLILSVAVFTMAILWFERSYGLGEEEEEVRHIRRASLAASIIFEGRNSLAFQKTPAQMRWTRARTSLAAASQLAGNSLLASISEANLQQAIVAAGAVPKGNAEDETEAREAKEAEEATAEEATAEEATAEEATAEEATAEGADMGAKAEPPGGAGEGDAPEPPPSPPGPQTTPKELQQGTKVPRKKKRKPLPPPSLNFVFSLVYPGSLGLIEGISHLTLKAVMSMFEQCFGSGFGPECAGSGVLWSFSALFVLVSASTVVWLKIVFTRYETTTALPIEYGTVNACSALSGLLFFREFQFMMPAQLAACLIGIVIVLLGVAVSVRTRLGCGGGAARIQPGA
jgi:hypothetical protein